MSWVGLLMLAALVAGSYLAVVWVPVYIVQWEAKAVVQDFSNRAVLNHDDERLLAEMCAKLRTLQRVKIQAEGGGTEMAPAIDLSPQEVTWERDTSSVPPTLHVAFEYPRQIYYPLLDRWTVTTMRVDSTADISLPDWGNAK